MIDNQRFARLALGVAVLLLSGCSAQMIRDRAQTSLREGHAEEAIKGLEEGLERHPDNPLLRSALLSTRAEAVARLAAQAGQLRTAGKFDEAEATLRKALAIDPRSDRIQTLIQEVRAESRAAGLVANAEKSAAAGRKDVALQLLDQALKEVPRHTGASVLRRRIEADLRLETGGAARVRLAESRPITLDFRGAPLSTVLEAITRGSGVNFILDKDVRQDSRVTLFLRSAGVEDALDLVTGAHQLARRIVDPQTVLIYPNTPEKHREHQDQVVRVFHLANAEAKATAQLLRTMLRLKEPFVDERANIVAIRESPEVVAMAERLVGLHDSGDAEVMLEVEILEVKTSRLTELGLTLPTSVTLTPLGLGSAGLTLGNARDINSDRIGLSVGSVMLNLRRDVGDVNILANPRIRAKNREKARVVIGDRFPVVTSTVNATGFVSETVNYLDVGLKLDVEPVVSLDDDVTIKLALEVSSLAGVVRTTGGSIAYQVGTRNANTTLRLRDGETQILAGLISNDERATANRIPGLGDLPIAGRLFSNQKDEFQRTELILAITPRVLRSSFRPEVSQAEMWVGTENAPRLKQAPRFASPAPVSDAGRPSTQLAVPAGAIAAPAPASVTPASTGPAQLALGGGNTLKTGEAQTVPIHISSAAALRGAMIELTYNPQQIEMLEVVEGSFFRQGGGTTSFTQSVNPATGKVGIGILRTDAAGGATGNGPAFELRVKPKSPGSIEIAVSSLRPVGLPGTTPSGQTSKIQLTAQ